MPQGWDRVCVSPDPLQGPKCVPARVGAEQAVCPQAVSMTPPVYDNPPVWLPLREASPQLPQEQMGAQPWGLAELWARGAPAAPLGSSMHMDTLATAGPGVLGAPEQCEG